MMMKTAAAAKHSAPAWRASRSTIVAWWRQSMYRSGCRSKSARIVRAFAGDRDVMGVAFTKSGVGYAHKGGAFAEIGKVATTDITHSGFQPARKLVQHSRHRSFVRNLPLNAFRDQF